MHFSIPDTQEFKDEGGSSYTSFNIHVNGVFHCTVRFKQLHNFHEQLKKEFGANNLPTFPPKRLLSLTPIQLEERRLFLERYVQIVSQDQVICNSDVFNGFFLSAQQETQREDAEDVTVDVYLMNGHKMTTNILSTDQTDDVLEAVASQIGLADDYVYFFGLYLVKKEDGGENSIVRKLQDFESPFISLKSANKAGGVHRIVWRKSYWDASYDDDLLDDRIAMNLIYVQAVSDLERGWIIATKDQHKQLASLQQKGSKKEFLRLVRTLKFYGFTQFKPCTTDYPEDNKRVMVCAGNKELNFRIEMSPDQMREVTFRVTRMRCWRITSCLNHEVNGTNKSAPAGSKLELAFEYLIAKDTLKWITLYSDEAILISMCLQGMVEELLLKKQGKHVRRPQDREKKVKRNYLKRDGTSNISFGNTDDEPTSASQKAKDSVKKLSDKLSSVSVKGVGNSSVPINNAFDAGITDDDL